MRAAGVDEDAAQFRGAPLLNDGVFDRADERRIENIRLGAIEPQTKQASVAIEPDFQRAAHAVRAPAFGIKFFDHRLAPRLALGEALAQGDEIDLAFVLRALVEGAEPGARLGQHVEGEPGAAVFLVAIPGVDFRLAQFLEALGQAFGERGHQLGAHRFDLGVERDRSTTPRATSALPAANAAPVRGSP